MTETPQWPSLAEELARRDWPECSSDAFVDGPAIASSRKEGRFAMAVSGGADSVCLALLAWAMLPKMRECMTVLHFNHRCRGKASDGDAAFVRQLADGLDVEYCEGSSERAYDNKVSEANLREERLAFFKSSGCGVILQGHQRDDILETMLMRLCRGSGLEGLSAPRSVSRHDDGLTFLRPLLGVGREEIRSALRDCGIPWREDASNNTDAYFRNRIRRSVIPVLREAFGRDPAEGAALSHGCLNADSEALDKWLSELLPEGFKVSSLDLRTLRSQPQAITRRALFKWLNTHGHDPPGALMRQMVRSIQQVEPASFNLSSDWRVDIDASDICLVRAGEPSISLATCTIRPGERVILSTGASLQLESLCLDQPLRSKVMSGGIDPQVECFLDFGEAFQSDSLTVRSWQPGDRYEPLCAPGSRKVQDIFTDAKIPQRERQRLPLVFHGEQLLWVPGFPPAHARRITEQTDWALRLTYEGV